MDSSKAVNNVLSSTIGQTTTVPVKPTPVIQRLQMAKSKSVSNL